MNPAIPVRDHAQAMDAIYADQRHIYDLTRRYYLLGRDRLIADLAPPPGGHVLEIGCGTARNLIAAARAWPDARFHGIDISAAMLVTAHASVARAGLRDRIDLVRGDAATFDAMTSFGRERFDRLFLSYTLSMIPPWVSTIDRAASALAPGGRLHIVDFGQQERLPTLWRRGLFAWLDRFDVTPRADLFNMVRAVAAERGLSVNVRALHRGYAWMATLTRD